MKKIKYLIVFVICVFSINAGVDAATNENLICENLKENTTESDCILLCEYEYRMETYGGAYSGSQYIVIKYHLNDMWEVQASRPSSSLWLGNLFSSDYIKYGPSAFSKFKTQIDFMSGNFSSSTFEDFVCPNYGYFDLELNNEICFDDDGVYCSNSSPGGIGTSFYNKFNLITNFEDELRKYIDSASIDKEEYAEIVNSGMKDDYISNKINEILVSAGLDELPNIENSPAFDELIAELNNSIKDSAEEFEEDVMNDDSLTDEEKEVLLEASKEITSQALNQLAEITSHINGLFNPSDVIDDCYKLLGESGEPGTTAYYLQMIFNVMKYIAIVALIVLSTVDYFRAIVEQDPNAFSRINKTTFKRLACCVVLFFFPIILDIFLELIGVSGSSSCGIN